MIRKITSEPVAQELQQINARVLSQCDMARAFIEQSQYEQARASLSEFWRRVGERPDLEWLDSFTSAEVLLRVGVLTSLLGSAQQLAGAQELAKDLISESKAIFSELQQPLKVIETETDLAVIYLREGAFAESRIMLKQTLKQLEAIECSAQYQARAVLNLAIVEACCANLSGALHILKEARPLFEAVKQPALKGRFHNELGLLLGNLSIIEDRADFADQSLIEFAAASYYFDEAGNKNYAAIVENNLGNAFFRLGRLEEAQEHLSRARNLFIVVKSRSHVAQVDESRARVLLAQAQYAEAEQAARNAVMILNEGDESALLVEALTTFGVALARLGKRSEAYQILLRAVETAERAGDMIGAGKAYMSIIEDLAEQFSDSELIAFYQKADGVLGDGRLDAQLTARMRGCMRLILKSAKQLPPFVPPGSSLDSEVLSFEKELIRKALIEAEGGITHAARRLGVTHQHLCSILNGRHQDLLAIRKPVRVRRRSLMNTPPKKYAFHTAAK